MGRTSSTSTTMGKPHNLAISDEAIEQTAAILIRQGINVVFCRVDGTWLFRHSSLPLTEMPKPLVAMLGYKVGQEFLLAMRAHHTATQISAAIRDVIYNDSVVANAFTARGIAAYNEGQFKKVLLIAPRGNYDGAQAPVISPHRGVEQLAAYLLENTPDVDARTFNPNLAGLERLEQLLKEEFFQVIGFSFLPITLQNDAEVIDLVASMSPDSLLVAGGLNVHKMPHERIFASVPFDILIANAGERTLKAILEHVPLGGKRSVGHLAERFGEIPNLYLYEHSTCRIIQTRREHMDPPPTNVEVMKHNIPYDQDDLTHHTHYQKQKRAVSQHDVIPYHLIGNRPFYVLNSDHCFHRCNFCSIRREKIKPSGPAAIVAEIKNAFSGEEPYDSVHFSDNDFFVFPDQVMAICEALIEAGLQAVPKYCKGCTDEISVELLRLLRAAGFLMVGYGIESFDDRILAAMNKQIFATQHERALEWTLAVGIKPGLNLIAFSPWETETSLLNTIERSLSYARRGAYLNLMPSMYTQLGDDFSSAPNNYRFIEYLTVPFTSTGEQLQVPYRVQATPDMERLRQQVLTQEREIVTGVKAAHFDSQAVLSQAVRSLTFIQACLETMLELSLADALRLHSLAEITGQLIAQTVTWEKRRVIVPPTAELFQL